MNLFSLRQCIPMEIFVIPCGDSESAHCHMLMGVTNSTPPLGGETAIFRKEKEDKDDEDLFFRLFEETLLSLN